MRLVFLGTPAFAVPSLEAVASEVVAVYTQPDRPKGRGQELAMPPVKEAALRLGIPVYQPLKIRTCVEELRSWNADAMIVVGYGQIIPQAIIDIPPLGIINVHASLLPKYRGAAPIQWAIARGETRTGVTTMRINAGLDTGDMLLKWSTEIGADETAVELGQRLAVAGADLLKRTLDELTRIVPEPQDGSQATLAPILKKEDGLIDWSRPAWEIANRVRGFQPWPGCYTFARGKKLGIWKARAVSGSSTIGAVMGGFRVGCGEGLLEVIEVQPEGKKRMSAAAFWSGHQVEVLG
ncbi:MAG: methionyl-tRNA formyltransferase [Acidobacteriia bacterium]|nr:methionyl-tRNA formyltransferase [Terriglobia bacterium]